MFMIPSPGHDLGVLPVLLIGISDSPLAPSGGFGRLDDCVERDESHARPANIVIKHETKFADPVVVTQGESCSTDDRRIQVVGVDVLRRLQSRD